MREGGYAQCIGAIVGKSGWYRVWRFGVQTGYTPFVFLGRLQAYQRSLN